MEENQASSYPVSDTPQQTSPPGEYEPIRIPRDRHPVKMSNRVDGYSSISVTSSHYQALSHHNTSGSSHQFQGPTYEPVRRPEFKDPDAQQAKNLQDTAYQPLSGVRLNPTDYQDLQTYNRNQLENNRNDESCISTRLQERRRNPAVHT